MEMASKEELDSSIEVLLEPTESQQTLNDSSQEKLVVEESPEEGVCRLCANHGKGVDMLLKENTPVRLVVKKYLHIEVHLIFFLNSDIKAVRIYNVSVCLNCWVSVHRWTADSHLPVVLHTAEDVGCIHASVHQQPAAIQAATRL
jgi:hypothetical protein